MIKNASISIAPDGAVLLSLPKTGMKVGEHILVSLEGKLLTVKQHERTYVRIPCQEKEAIDAFLSTEEFLVVEVDDDGLQFFENVERGL